MTYGLPHSIFYHKISNSVIVWLQIFPMIVKNYSLSSSFCFSPNLKIFAKKIANTAKGLTCIPIFALSRSISPNRLPNAKSLIIDFPVQILVQGSEAIPEQKVPEKLYL